MESEISEEPGYLQKISSDENDNQSKEELKKSKISIVSHLLDKST